MAMSQQESLAAIHDLLKACDEDELSQLIARYLPNVDGVFFATLNQSVAQLERERKPHIAHALAALGSQILKMKTLI
jgi:hypothetical protein